MVEVRLWPMAERLVPTPPAPDPRLLVALQRSMAERLELALSWNLLASELRAGMAQAKRPR